MPGVPLGPFTAGSVYYDPDAWIEYTAGDAPLILLAPHGGSLSPAIVPDRTCSGCETVNDAYTQELARAVADSFAGRTGRRPHLVVNLLRRRKLDANRDLAEATDKHPVVETSWVWWHAFIDSASAAIARTDGRGLLLDMHGHAHPVNRLELGYLLYGSTLRQDDSSLAASGVMAQSSIARLALEDRSGAGPVALLNGLQSLGGLLAAVGVSAVPSPSDRAPLSGQDYLSGGYNVWRHGSLHGGSMDAIQIEHPFPGIRDDPGNRARYAGRLVTALTQYLDLHYGWR